MSITINGPITINNSIIGVNFLPNQPTPSPTPTITLTASPTPTITLTASPTPSPSPSPTPSPSPSPTPSATGGATLSIGKVYTGYSSGSRTTTISSTGITNASLLVVMLAWDSGGPGTETVSITSTPSLTWKAAYANGNVVQAGNSAIFYATGTTGNTITITGTTTASIQASMSVIEFKNYDTTTTGATANAGAFKVDTPSVNITTTKANSIVVGVISDWTPATGTVTYRRSVTEIARDTRNLVNYIGYHFYDTTITTATTYTEGLSSPTGQQSTCLLFEIRSA